MAAAQPATTKCNFSELSEELGAVDERLPVRCITRRPGHLWQVLVQTVSATSQLWDARERRVVRTFSAASQTYSSVFQFSPDGEWLLLIGMKNEALLCRVDDPASTRTLRFGALTESPARDVSPVTAAAGVWHASGRSVVLLLVGFSGPALLRSFCVESGTLLWEREAQPGAHQYNRHLFGYDNYLATAGDWFVFGYGPRVEVCSWADGSILHVSASRGIRKPNTALVTVPPEPAAAGTETHWHVLFVTVTGRLYVYRLPELTFIVCYSGMSGSDLSVHGRRIAVHNSVHASTTVLTTQTWANSGRLRECRPLARPSFHGPRVSEFVRGMTLLSESMLVHASPRDPLRIALLHFPTQRRGCARRRRGLIASC